MTNNVSKKEIRPIPLLTYALGAVVLWSTLLALSLVWNIKTERSGILELARMQARTAFEKDVIYRRWNAEHGGLYAPVTARTKPNPYLDVAERDITTPLGKKLTMINPAYMTRQAHDVEIKAYGIKSHITSLNPIRPENVADTWENHALKAFNNGLKEVSSVEKMDGEKYMRLMHPLITEKGCIKCHGAQGYELGDIRGGISISIPMAPIMAISKHKLLTLSVGHGLLLLFGLIWIGLGIRHLKQQIHKRIGVEDALQQRTSDLGERAKKLNCLYGISNLIEKPDISLEEIIKGVVDLIPLSLKYPEITCSRILLKDEEYKTLNFKETEWKQSGEIFVTGKRMGILEVFYLEKRPEIYEGPFHKEERLLIDEITDRLEMIIEGKWAEEALRESEKKYRSMMEAMKDPVYICSPDFRVEYMNPAMIRRVGRDATGEKCFKALHDLDEKCSWCTHHVIQQLKHLEIDIVSPKDNRSYHVSQSPIVHEDGSTSKMTVFKDTTDFIKMEAQLRQIQKMEAIGTLAGGIAHDFNNILTTIIGNAHMALMEVGKDTSLHREIEEIKKAGQRAASLTRQLLAFSRKQVIKPEVLDINNVISEMEKMLKRMIGEDIEFQTVLEPELWKVHMDSGQIDQVIINIAVNSRDAMPQGGKLVVETANVCMDENYFREHGIDETPGHYVMLAISDTGSGMDKETREHIFEPFFTTKEIGKGTGLGLSTVYGIAKQNNGFIWVYSEPGHGTTFKIYLPKVKEGAELEEKERIPVGDLNGSETVLVVEDDDRVRNLALKILERYEYSVLAAENGEDALRVSEKYEGQIDLMLTDVVMPKMSGKETAEGLQPLYPQMKVIYMSGYTDEAIVHHGVLEPGLNFLEKPFTPEGLARKVREALGD